MQAPVAGFLISRSGLPIHLPSMNACSRRRDWLDTLSVIVMFRTGLWLQAVKASLA